MELTLPYIAASVFLLLVAFKFLSQKIHHSCPNIPPSPPSLPVIGHLHLLHRPVYRTFHNLTKTLGPIFSLRLGSRLIVVISSSPGAEECFTKNDIVLANRPHFMIGKYLDYKYTTVVASSYGDHWRNLRRIMSLEIFSTKRLNAFLSIRQDEIRHLLRQLHQKSSADFAKVEMRPKLNGLTFNIIVRMITGKRYYGDDLEDTAEAAEFRELVNKAFEYAGSWNPGDYMPVLGWIDYKGFEKNLAKFHKRLDVIFQGLIDERRRDESKNTMIDHLLSLQESQPEYYTDPIIKGLISVMILAGTDTSAVTLEWTMSLLVNHPQVLQKARAEIDAHVGQDRLIDEHDLQKLPYLQAIISETMRICPPGPLLFPHVSSDDCTIGGYNIPRDTILMVNAWTIHRDPKVWDDPTSFKPERFEGKEVEAYKLMPFGFGRRACPGVGLAQRVVGLALGSMIQCFQWERVGEDLVDLTGGSGLTMHKVEPLETMCKARDIMKKVLSGVANDA